MSRKVIAKAARYLDDKECQRPANVSCRSGRQGTLPRKVPGSERCADALLGHGMLQLKARQFRAWWRRMNGRGPVSRHLQLPASRGLKHAHALESELSMLTGGVSYCRFSFHGGVKHVHDPATHPSLHTAPSRRSPSGQSWRSHVDRLPG